MDLKYLAVMVVLAVATYAPFSQGLSTDLLEPGGDRCKPTSRTFLCIQVEACYQQEHGALCVTKPISLVERCWCRSTVNTVPQRNIRELKFLHTPNCPFQVIAKLKNHKEVCINPETKWLQQYLKNALNKMKTSKQTN
uniref:stromal cell-derived factor 1-like isoform X1 n=1 Tax=Oncorhynchus gorbuscha TaxID=8017 RepID=UPI001EAF0D03|nr:stromal cell-derived factor 1-like isoform X1 [Oncorhynchus gorbuscha]XP_046209480.1 stromal cell-derived factor 1-like isoform X1 [Oncorhynchus gorbuscha]XP_046209482.1 stromal cell-derived factor 1-like isoform X1 [Oncorhynchus gorbuscha]